MMVQCALMATYLVSGSLYRSVHHEFVLPCCGTWALSKSACSLAHLFVREYIWLYEHFLDMPFLRYCETPRIEKVYLFL